MLKRWKLFISFLLLWVGTCHLCQAQDSILYDLHFEVNKIYPELSVSKTQFRDALTLRDVHRFFKSDCNAKEYYSVEISALKDGVFCTAKGSSDTINQRQKELIVNADSGTEMVVKVFFLPDNTLQNNEVKEFDFAFTIHPENDASYIKGEEKLLEYIKAKAIDLIPYGSFKNYDLVSVKFTVAANGQIVNPHVFWHTEHKNVEKLLLETICNMPPWQPAEYRSGKKVDQDFVLTVGNHKSCVLNTLNIDTN